jgi:colanic acid/amylovoran biosynthesis glycosyltransferase
VGQHALARPLFLMADPERPIRLLEVGLAWPPETYNGWKFEGLADRGFEVLVASALGRSRVRTQLRGVTLVRIPRWEERPLARGFGALWDGLVLAVRDRAAFRRLLRALITREQPGGRPPLLVVLGRFRDHGRLARLRPDVVHFEWESAAIRHLPLFEVWQCPVVLSCHGAGVNVYPISRGDPKLIHGLRTVFERATAVQCVSSALVAEAARYGLDPRKVSVIRPAVDPRFFSPDGRDQGNKDSYRIVSVGLRRWLKGWEYGLEAVGRAIRLGVPARLELFGADPEPDVGEEGETERLLYTVEDLGLVEYVRLAGDVPSTEIRTALRRADVLLHPSLSEGVPTVILEAMACGIPVVASDCGGVREAVRDGIDGFVVPLRDAGALTDALVRLWRDPELRVRMGTAARERVRSSFALDDQLDQYVELYRGVVSRRAAQ